MLLLFFLSYWQYLGLTKYLIIAKFSFRIFVGSDLQISYHKNISAQINFFKTTICHNKLLWSNKVFGINKYNSSNTWLGAKNLVNKNVGPNFFWPNKFYVPKNIVSKNVQQMLAQKIDLGYKNIWSEILFSPKKLGPILGPKKI